MILFENNNYKIQEEDFQTITLNGIDVHYYFNDEKEYQNKVVHYQQLLGCRVNYIPKYIHEKLVIFKLEQIQKNKKMEELKEC